MTKILLLGSQHGDEHLGEKLYSYITNQHPELLEHIEFLTANPKARKKNKRYIESDMNRSYNGQTNTYEERRANKILKYIDKSKFDLVLDLHTTHCKQPPCLIMAAVGPETTRFIQASSITQIVVMNNPIVKTSLNGVRPMVISIEINNGITDDIHENLCSDMKRYLQNTAHDIRKYVYEITDLLQKSEISVAEAKALQNFKLSNFGYYPILVDENSYSTFTNYLGFKAYNRYVFKV
jgi:succinylglutamate desuccinylase